MSILSISPIRLTGSFSLGFALEKHIQSSNFFGNDSAGHTLFDTSHTGRDQALFLIKYRSDQCALSTKIYGPDGLYE